MPRNERIDSDLVVVGAGAAGLYSALTAASLGASVTVISATPLAQTASYWAQGGLAAALGADDSDAATASAQAISAAVPALAAIWPKLMKMARNDNSRVRSMTRADNLKAFRNRLRIL